MNQETPPVYVFCILNSLEPDIAKKIQNNLKEVFRDLKKEIDFEHPTDYEAAFSALSKCMNANIRLFSHSDDSSLLATGSYYAKNILQFVCSVKDYRKAINLQIVSTNNDARLPFYDPTKGERTFAVSSNTMLDKKLLKSLIRTIYEPAPIYISYGNDKSHGQARYVIRKFRECVDIAFPHLAVIDDLQLKYKDNVLDLISAIQNGDYVVMIINKKYFQSKYSMAEYDGIRAKSKLSGNEKFMDRIYPLVLESGRDVLREESHLVLIINEWEKRLSEIKSLIAKNKPDIAVRLKLSERLDFHNRTIDSLYEIPLTVAALKAVEIENDNLLESISKILWSIHEKMVATGHFRLYSTEENLYGVLRSAFLDDCICMFQTNLEEQSHE